MAEHIEKEARKNLAEILPGAIRKALQSYHRFAAMGPEEDDTRSFSAHHSACKAAIAHLELLLKLARWAKLDTDQDKPSNPQSELMEILRSARAELEEKKQEMETDDE